jgi:uncharacterized protein (DUF58 family)
MLSADEARQLDRLGLAAPIGSLAASASGQHRARSRGYGLEFHDYRPYQPGDELRAIDWTIDARLRQLVVRVFQTAGQLRLHLLVDISRSMTAGAPSKLACARKLAAALCYAAVVKRDAVGVATFDDTIRDHVPPAAGRRQIFRVFEALGGAAGVRASDIDRALLDYGAVIRGPGLAVVCSDFFQPEGRLDGLRYLAYRGLVPIVVQIVADEELQPHIADETELVDLEHPASVLVVDDAAIEPYRTAMQALHDQLAAFCASVGTPFMRIPASASFDALLGSCRQAGLLALR